MLMKFLPTLHMSIRTCHRLCAILYQTCHTVFALHIYDPTFLYREVVAMVVQLQVTRLHASDRFLDLLFSLCKCEKKMNIFGIRPWSFKMCSLAPTDIVEETLGTSSCICGSRPCLWWHNSYSVYMALGQIENLSWKVLLTSGFAERYFAIIYSGDCVAKL